MRSLILVVLAFILIKSVHANEWERVEQLGKLGYQAQVTCKKNHKKISQCEAQFYKKDPTKETQFKAMGSTPEEAILNASLLVKE